MQATAYVQAFQERGVILWREGGALRYKAPPGVLTPDLLAKLKKAKAAILPVLPTAPENLTKLDIREKSKRESSSTGRDLRGVAGSLRQTETEKRLGKVSQSAPLRLSISSYSDHPGPLTEPPSDLSQFRAWAEGEAAGLVAAGLLPELEPAFVTELEELALSQGEKNQRAVAAQVRRACVGEILIMGDRCSPGPGGSTAGLSGFKQS
ncbi:hypothetical protein [Armatimonas sp.]|uniref:TubC N-terminal docking domain-related protein n=1 Tax=Armatimonas sp. TaxID=1872638 RepID=UPI00374DF944